MKKNRLITTLIVICLLSAFYFFINKNNQVEVNNNSSNNSQEVVNEKEYVEYHFRNNKLLSEHYDKHGKDMGFKSKEDYEKAASDVANNENVLHKLEKEDKDDVYYLEETNEFVIVSSDGYLRTYFLPDAGKSYFDKQ